MQHSYKVPEAYRPHSSRFPKIYHYSCSLREKDVVFKQERLKSCSWSQPIRSQSRCGLKLKRDRAGVVHLMYYRERYAQNWSEICCGIHSFFYINVIVSQFHRVCLLENHGSQQTDWVQINKSHRTLSNLEQVNLWSISAGEYRYNLES